MCSLSKADRNAKKLHSVFLKTLLVWMFVLAFLNLEHGVHHRKQETIEREIKKKKKKKKITIM